MIRHGLKIGIDYRGTANRLAGCIADSESWRGLFDPICNGGLLKLQEQSATKRNMVEAIKAITAVCPQGSDHEFIITFSGHGTYRHGATGEADGRDEAICCFDFQQGGLLWDNEIALLLQGSQGLFITDCCHSATLTRTFVADSPDAIRPRFIPFDQITEGLMQCEICKLTEGADNNRAQARSIRDASGAIPGIVHLAGCLDNEFSYDANFGGKPNGAMTYFAIESYRQLPQGANYQQWIDLIQRKLPKPQYPQNPQMTATADDLRRALPGKELAPVVASPSVETFEAVTSTGRKIRGTIG